MNLIETLFFHSINNSLITNLSEMLSKEDILQNFKRGPDWRPTEVFSGTIQFSNKCCLLNAFGSVCILFLAMMNVNVYETFFFACKLSSQNIIQSCCETRYKIDELCPLVTAKVSLKMYFKEVASHIPDTKDIYNGIARMTNIGLICKSIS